MTTLCIVFSAGWAIACVGLLLLFLLADVSPKWPVAIVLLVTAFGTLTCAAEDRVCEAAGMEGR